MLFKLREDHPGHRFLGHNWIPRKLKKKVFVLKITYKNEKEFTLR